MVAKITDFLDMLSVFLSASFCVQIRLLIVYYLFFLIGVLKPRSVRLIVKIFSDNESEAGRYRGLILCNPYLLVEIELQGPRRRSRFFGKNWHLKPSRVEARWVSFLGQGYF